MIEMVRDFLDGGGNVMKVLAWVIFVMWTLIIERLLFMLTENRIGVKAVLAAHESHRDRHSWSAQAIYDAAVSRVSMRLEAGIRMIRALARLCPLFGLLGTVTGMILIFDVMAATGGGSPRAMAAGVAKATLTTMAGMVGALSGIFPASMLNQVAETQRHSLQMHYLASSRILLLPISGFPKLLRIVLAPVVAFFITMGLVFLMQSLIETGEKAIQKVMVTEYADFIRVRKIERLEMRNIKPKKIMPDEMPEKLDPRPVIEDDAGAMVINYAMTGPAAATMELPGLTSDFGAPDGEFLPLVRVLPLYPRRAKSLGLEGWVIVRFAITASGTTADVVADESSNRIFETAAIRAVQKFKYRPRIVDGRPVAVTGVRHMITFVIED